jgi:hypothetical protein
VPIPAPSEPGGGAPCEFWRASGYRLLDRDAGGRLVVTDAFLCAYLNRPEIRPVDESGPAELRLHAALLAEPRRAVAPQEIAAVEDADARENYDVWLSFRDHLLATATVEAAYLALFHGPPKRVPGLFVDQLAHVLIRHVLDGVEDPLRARSGELFFREQSVSTEGGRVMLADRETVEMLASSGGFGSLGRLVAEAQTPLRRVELDVLDEANGAVYWSRDERHDTVLDLGFARPGLDAFCRVLEAWVAHFLGVAVRIGPVQRIRDERWVWHTGLDAESSAILNDLYAGREVEEDRLARLLSLFRLDFENPLDMRADIAGRPVYLGLGMTEAGRLRLKPQNLLVNLPLRPKV